MLYGPVEENGKRLSQTLVQNFPGWRMATAWTQKISGSLQRASGHTDTHTHAHTRTHTKVHYTAAATLHSEVEYDKQCFVSCHLAQVFF